MPPHLFGVYYSLGVPKGLEGSKISFPLYYRKRMTKFCWDSEAYERNQRKNMSEELQETKAFWEIPRLPQKRTVTDSLCKTTIFSFLPTRTSATHFERERKNQDSKQHFTQLSHSAKPHCSTSPKPAGRQKCKIMPFVTYRNKTQCLHGWRRDTVKLITNWNKCRVEVFRLLYLPPLPPRKP